MWSRTWKKVGLTSCAGLTSTETAAAPSGELNRTLIGLGGGAGPVSAADSTRPVSSSSGMSRCEHRLSGLAGPSPPTRDAGSGTMSLLGTDTVAEVHEELRWCMLRVACSGGLRGTAAAVSGGGQCSLCHRVISWYAAPYGLPGASAPSQGGGRPLGVRSGMGGLTPLPWRAQEGITTRVMHGHWDWCRGAWTGYVHHLTYLRAGVQRAAHTGTALAPSAGSPRHPTEEVAGPALVEAEVAGGALVESLR
jgi:hypothetical protein